MNYREGGYLDTIPQDPWGREYLYQPSAFGGVAKEVKIVTLGADGAEGGSAENTDINSRHMKYLNHLANL
jgi:general secretion pathway protein G